MQYEEIELEIAAGKIAALRWRNSAAQSEMPVLALHGWLDNANSFMALAEQLRASFSDIVAIDLPGHGRSSHRPQGCQYHLVDFVFDISSVLQQLGWDQFILIGHSMGASIATLVAAATKRHLQHLVLIDGIGPMSTNGDGVSTQLSKSIRHYQRLNETSIPQTYPNWEVLIQRRMAAGDLSFADAKLLMQRNAKEMHDEIVWIADARLKVLSPLYLHEEQVLGFLSSIVAPTLLIQAQSGLVINRKNTQRRIQAMSNITVNIIPGGHHLHMENSLAIAETINDFLQERVT